ncbi:hypothetical protein SAMN05444141_102665 [Pseudovibrio denitrificans]|uniref:Uncharacterized protein n=1 Tax=Pseudovibrio denitrificans TaxID=258256 RepID=A0A1I6ZWT3_9HYPH|nr:terminase family protein [Pseudovibrio denitrificans]SFT67067.1 hypothetical protein SAMN05444141_102665 [Pseudovibrio denitrificans]
MSFHSPEGFSTAELIAEYELDEEFDPYRYVPPGPVARNFIRNSILTKAIMGPVGGGKTVACAMARVVAATLMPPCKDGVIRDKWVVVRTSFRDAEKTVLASWQQWFPKDYPGSSWTGGNDRPVTHILKWRLPDGTRVEAETIFLGLQNSTVAEKLRGMEISGAWLNEMDTIDEHGLKYLEQRTGRYPKKSDLKDPNAKRFRQVIGDFNAPDVDNWTYDTFVENPSPNRVLYQQPSGLSPKAENLRNLEPDYYLKIVENEEEWYIRRFVRNEFGFSRDGKPVYSDYNGSFHTSARDLKPDQSLPLLIGLDAGLNPSAILGQPRPNGQLIITDELVPGQGYGADRLSELLNDLIARRYYQVPSIRIWADPAAQYGADKEGGELSWIETVSKALSEPVLIPANGSNELGLRLAAVRAELTKLIDGHAPRLLISRHCKKLNRGFASGYKYKKRPKDAGPAYDPEPSKNEYSHPHDALQYLVLGYRGRPAVVSDAAGSRRDRGDQQNDRRGPPPKKGSFDPHNT